jgi:hypothetical protein
MGALAAAESFASVSRPENCEKQMMNGLSQTRAFRFCEVESLSELDVGDLSAC